MPASTPMREFSGYEDTNRPSPPSPTLSVPMDVEAEREPAHGPPDAAPHDQRRQRETPRNAPSAEGISIGVLLRGGREFRQDGRGHEEDQPGNVAADEDCLDLIREAYAKGVIDPDQLLKLAENAQPSPVRDALFSVRATFAGNLQTLSRPKIIANLKLIDDNSVVRQLLEEHAIVYLHKLPRNQIMFQVDSKEARKKLEGQKCLLFGKILEFEKCDPLSDDYFIDIMGIHSQSTARKIFQALVYMGCRPLYYNATFLGHTTQVSSGILRFFVAGRTCPKALLVKGIVCNQILLDGTMYAAKGKDVPPQFYHLQPNKISPQCIDMSELPFRATKNNTTTTSDRAPQHHHLGNKRSREPVLSSPTSKVTSEPDLFHQNREDPEEHQLDLSIDFSVTDVSAPSSPTQSVDEAFKSPPKRLQSRRSCPPPTPSAETWHSPNFWNHLADIETEVECRTISDRESVDKGFQLLVKRVEPSEQVTNSGEFSFYHEKKKGKAKLSTNPVLLRELIPAMKTDIEESLQTFTRDNEDLPEAITRKDSRLLSTSPNAEDIWKQIAKNRLAFSLKLSKLMRQKSTLIDEFASIHLWYRCIQVSTSKRGANFSKKWMEITGMDLPKTRSDFMGIIGPLATKFGNPNNLLERSKALAFFELLLLTVAPVFFNKDYWIQKLANSHVPWIPAADVRLLHPNVLLALLRAPIGGKILEQLATQEWENSIMTTLVLLRSEEDWFPNDTAVLRLTRDGNQLNLEAGSLPIDC